MTAFERWTRKIDTSTGHWLWTGAVDSHGYGHFRVDGRTESAHIFAYETFVGPVPAGKQLDHLCRIRRCSKPDCLEPVTCGENLRRGEGATGVNFRKTHCIAGHEFSTENTTISAGKRYCRACMRRRRQERTADVRP